MDKAFKTVFLPETANTLHLGSGPGLGHAVSAGPLPSFPSSIPGKGLRDDHAISKSSAFSMAAMTPSTKYVRKTH